MSAALAACHQRAVRGAARSAAMVATVAVPATTRYSTPGESSQRATASRPTAAAAPHAQPITPALRRTTSSLGMSQPLRVARPRRLKELRPSEVAAIALRDPRLIVPVGTCEQHGPHLPFGCDTIIVEHLADDLSA